MTHGHEKSDPAIVARKPANKAALAAAESAERRAGAKGNARQQSTLRTQIRAGVTQALDRVRQAARLRKKERFIALLHHVSIDALQTAFYALKRKAAPGVDGMTRGIGRTGYGARRLARKSSSQPAALRLRRSDALPGVLRIMLRAICLMVAKVTGAKIRAEVEFGASPDAGEYDSLGTCRRPPICPV